MLILLQQMLQLQQQPQLLLQLLSDLNWDDIPPGWVVLRILSPERTTAGRVTIGKTLSVAMQPTVKVATEPANAQKRKMKVAKARLQSPAGTTEDSVEDGNSLTSSLTKASSSDSGRRLRDPR